MLAVAWRRLPRLPAARRASSSRCRSAARDRARPRPGAAAAIRVNCARRLAARAACAARQGQRAFLRQLRGRRRSPLEVEKPNEQHYEVPVELFRLVLGPRLKYSCCHWPTGSRRSPRRRTRCSSSRARAPGSRTGWRSSTSAAAGARSRFWLAERYPVGARARRLELAAPARVDRGRGTTPRSRGDRGRTADANVFEPGRRFDRVLSVEMLEHARNYPALLAPRRRRGSSRTGGSSCTSSPTAASRIPSRSAAGWPETSSRRGRCPRTTCSPRSPTGSRWRSAGPSSGEHYARTSEAWLERLDERRGEVLRVLAERYGREAAAAGRRCGAIFFMACAELWGFRGGREWGVSHYRFAPA